MRKVADRERERKGEIDNHEQMRKRKRMGDG